MDIYIGNIVIPDEIKFCTNFNCKNHTFLINNLFDKIMEAINKASDFALLKSENKFSKNKSKNKNGVNSQMAGWNQYVKPHRDLSILYSNIWKDNGCSIGDITDQNRKIAKKITIKLLNI